MQAATEPSFAVNDVVADFGAETLRDRAGHPLPLRPQAFAVLRYLAANPGRLVTKDELMAAVWPHVAVTDDSLVQCIGDIRRAIGDEAHAVVRTVPRRGYRLVPPAEPAPAAAGRSLRRRSLAAAAALLIAGAAGAGWLTSRPPPGVASMDGPPIVALVPFVDLTRDRTSLGLYDALQKQCNFARDFVMVRRGPDFVYRDQPADALAVDYMFGGRIERDGNRLRVVAELVDAPTGTVLWSERWDRPDDDIPAMQAEIAAQVSNRLGGANGLIQQLGRPVAERKRPGERTAWENVLLGRGQLALGTRAGAVQAAALLGRAVELEPGLAHASALLALAHLRLAEFGADPESNLRAAIEAAELSVFLDGVDPWAHAALGAGFRLSGDFVRARSEFETALVLAPNTAEIMALFAGWAASGGEPERGAEIADQVTLFDPIVPPPAAGQLARP